MEPDEYLTISGSSKGIYKEKGSKFLGFAFHVASEDDAKKHLDRVKNQYHDARHHCYAYRIGPEGEVFRMNDDGEPSSTAGKPIFGQIKSHNLTDVLVVVVRYFGGTLLGTSGLIRSYKQAADDALKQAQIIKKTVQAYYQVEFDYPLMNEMMKLLHDTGIQPYKKKFKERCTFWLGIRQSAEEKTVEQFRRVQGIHIEKIKMNE